MSIFVPYSSFHVRPCYQNPNSEVGIVAKPSNAYSRPYTLLISLIGALSGLMRVSYYGTKWVDFSVGSVGFSFGKSGVLIVIYVMIADMSHLRWCVWLVLLLGEIIRNITAQVKIQISL